HVCYLVRCCVFLIMRRPLISPLFPYTTLFRSDVTQFPVRTICRDRRTRPAGRCLPSRRHRAATSPRGARNAAGGRAAAPPAASRDRKSTRLNSSHVKISYAVFCLKKKKRKRNT